MELKYIDAHCHLQFEQYDADRDTLIAQMRERGVAGIVVWCDFESSKKAVELAEQHEHLWAAIGQHPNDNHTELFDASAYRALAASKKVVAIGECGLDYFRPVDATDEVKAKQRELFTEQIELAAELALPLIIHSRPSSAKAMEGKPSYDAYWDLIEILKEAKEGHPKLAGDIHFFVGGVAEMRALNALGFTVSYTAVITFARDYDATIKAAPLDQMLVETDSPFVAPASRRGQRNDPLAVIEVVAKIAEIRGENPELVRAALAANAARLFELPFV